MRGLTVWFVVACGGLSTGSGSLLDRLPRNLTHDDHEPDECGVTAVILTVTPPEPYTARCAPIEVMTFGCRGACSSYVRVQEDEPGELTRNCRCCEPTRYGVHLATVDCIDGTQLRTAVKFAMECSCRNCVAFEPPLQNDGTTMTLAGVAQNAVLYSGNL